MSPNYNIFLINSSYITPLSNQFLITPNTYCSSLHPNNQSLAYFLIKLKKILLDWIWSRQNLQRVRLQCTKTKHESVRSVVRNFSESDMLREVKEG